MVGILRKADREPVAQVAKKHGISEQTIYTWRQRFSGMNADEVKRLRQLEQENSPLKKLLAERDLEIEVMKEIAAKKNGERTRQTPAGGLHAPARGVATQGVCAVLLGPFSALLRVAHEASRRSARGFDGGACGPVSPVRLSQDSGVHGARGAQDGAGQGLPALVRGRAPGAEEASAQAGCRFPAQAQRAAFRQ